jgi:hypothetical protein
MFHVVLVLIAVGVGLWLLSLIKIDPTIRLIIRVVVIICVVFWLIQVFGLLSHDIPVPRL